MADGIGNQAAATKFFPYHLKNIIGDDIEPKGKSVQIRTKYEKLNRLEGKKVKEWSCPDSHFEIPLALAYTDGGGCFNKRPDLSQMDSLIEEFKAVTMIELGLEVSDLPYYVECMRTSIYVSGFILYSHSIFSNQVKAMSYLSLVLYLYDNELDEVRPTESKTSLSYSDLLTFNKLITNIISGKSINFNSVTHDLGSINFPHKYAILKFLKKYNELAHLSIDNYKVESGNLIKLIDEHFQAQAWGVLESNSKEKIESTIDTYIFRRERTSAYYPCYEYSRLAKGIDLPNDFKNSVIRGQIDRLANVIGCLVNDLLSWDREIHGTLGHNYFYMKLSNSVGLTAAEVSVKIVRRIERDVKELIRLCNLVEKEWSVDSVVAHYLQHIRKCVDQNLFLHLYCPRYSYGIEWTVNT